MIFLIYFYVVVVSCQKLAVVIDAGSTGSRVHVFKWFFNKTACNGNGAINLNLPEKTVKMNPGLITYINRESAKDTNITVNTILQNYVNNLKSHIDSLIEEDINRADIPIFYLATAGFRQLSEQEQQSIIKILREYMNKWEYLVQDDWIEVLDGRKEGLFSWVFLNQLLSRRIGVNESGSFENLIISSSNQSVKETNLAPTKLIEFGGASTQVVFSTTTDVNDNKFNNNTPIQLDGNIVHLKFCNDYQNIYASSFQGYGRQLALQVFIRNYINKTNSYRVPCLPPDIFIPIDNINNLAFENIGRPFTEEEAELISSNKTITGVIGLEKSNYEICKDAVKKYLLDLIDPVESNDQPFVEIVGNENIDFFHQLVAIPQRPYSTETNLDWFRRRAEILCRAESYSVIQALLHPDAEPEKVITGCFGLTFIINFLKIIVHVPTSKKIKALSKIRGVEVAWPAGFMLTEMVHRLSQLNHTNMSNIILNDEL